MSQQFPQFPAQQPKKPHMFRTAMIILAGAVIGVVALVLILAAVFGSAVDNATDAPVSVTSRAGATTPAPSVTTEPSETPTQEPANDTVAIGKTLTYESGLAVTVVSVKTFTPEYASGLKPGEKAVKVTWTIKNGTDATFDLAMAEARLTYGPDGTQAENVYADGVGGQYPFDGSVRPGQKKTATSAFSVPKVGLSKIVVEVEPGMDSQTAYFEGRVK